MLEELSKKDNIWRDFAYRLCNDKMLADDVVQEMYLKSLRYNKPLKDAYIKLMLSSIFLDICRKKSNNKTVSIESFYFLKDDSECFQLDDYDLEILKRYNDLDWKQKELIKLSYDKSLRQIEKELPLINYGFAFRQIKEGRAKILKDK